ncbi:MAG: response regulator transcription factor [Desulfobaccales bacterium]
MNNVASLGQSEVAPFRVLVIDDEKTIRITLSACLEAMGCRVTTIATASEALAALERQPFDLAFLDLRLKEMSGLDLIPKLLSISPHLHIVMITAYATVETAVEAIKRGARDYLPKPFNLAQIRDFLNSLAARLSDVPLLGGDYSLEQIEQEHILRIMARTSTLDEAAHILGIAPSTLWRKRKTYDKAHQF